MTAPSRARNAKTAALTLVALTVTLPLATPASAAGGIVATDRVSVATDGTQADGLSILPATDAAGRYVAFLSYAANLVPGDTNGFADVFVRDTRTGTTRLVSAGLGGAPANRPSGGPRISADGRYIVYYSTATNITEPGTDKLPAYNVYVYDQVEEKTERVPTGSDGGMIVDISGDGRYVTYQSWSNDAVPGGTQRGLHVFVHDRVSGETELVSRAADGGEGDQGGADPRISADGRYVTFVSDSTNLVAGDTNDKSDVFVRDLGNDTTVRVSVATDGSQSVGWIIDTSISADGRIITYSSNASDLVAGDTNNDFDVFVHDTATRTTTLISDGHDGTPAQSGFALSPEVSGDGRHVLFWSNAWNVVPDDTNYAGDAFVHDRVTGVNSRVSVTSAGGQSEGSDSGVLSADGQFVFYRAAATDLVPEDTNGVEDIFRTQRF